MTEGGALDRIDSIIERVVRAAAWLALPISVLLFLQWPLRDLVRGYAREANDVGQVLFALYVAVAVTAATRRGTHLAAESLAQRYSARARIWLLRAGLLLALLPWSVFVLIAGWPLYASSVSQLERFADTGNPGYVIVKLSAALMAALMVLQGIRDLVRGTRGQS
ncbi:TRAP transporter small permease subunit [uncultured Alsobacter sp.]|uniref:TRAP transporter small permease subunit n=1 Tax=uncultured Alsobacter sp. TaxID=1748258 RepID=UPI0025EB7120|nr:TRAP transporter small permease subunit [uncultured Alsobacter sp.]